MNFFEQQAKVRQRSRGLVLLFGLAVAGIVAAIDLVVLAAWSYGRHGHYAQPAPVHSVLIWTSLAVLAFISSCSLYRIAVLSGGGGSAVARELGATLVSPDTADARHRKLRNVVEEVAIASGVPVPQIFVLEQETGINAFASGFSTSDAAVTVTRGALDKLSRDELQGVIGHEFSHILNGDMRLNIRLMGLLFGILALGVVAGKILQSGPGSRDRRGGAILFVALGVMAVGYIGVFFGRLIKAGVSRQREYLADASAVQFTRQTAGIAGALKKLAGLAEGSRLHDVHGEEVAHMLFGDGIGYSAWFATHPALVERIKALEPQFDPREIEAARPRWNAPDYVPEDAPRPLAADFGGAAPALALAAGGVAATPPAVAAMVGRPQGAHYDCAAQLRQSLPAPLLAAAHGQDSAVQLIYALLLDAQPVVRDKQYAVIEKNFGAAARAAVAALGTQLGALPRAQRLPLAAIALPSLRRQPRDELIRLMMTVSVLVHADGGSGVFEYCLARLLRMYIAEVLRPGRAAAPGRRKLDECQAEIQALLAVVAELGQDDAESARHAFLVGLEPLPLREGLTYRPPQNWAKALDEALGKLDQLEPPAKALLLEALSATVAADGRVTVEEAELLRAICASLHCPLPPVLPEPAAAAA